MTAQGDPWLAAYEPWAAARQEEHTYDADVWLPAYEAGQATQRMDAEVERLMDRRFDLEGALFAVPALNAVQLATKVLIAFDNGREAVYTPEILADCRRFADDSLTRGRLSEGTEASPWRDAGHRDWLTERNAVFERCEREGASSDADDHRMNALEAMILGTPAQTADDVISKLVLVAQIVAEGMAPCPDAVAPIVAEARDHFGLGVVLNANGEEKHDA